MSNKTINNTFHINGSTQIHQQNEGEANFNNYASHASINNAIDEIKNILNKLNNKYSNVSETTATEIINAEFTHIQNNQPEKWAIIKHIFDGKRWLNGGKTAFIKVGEHYSENNVFCKAVVGFGEGFSDS
ncbi:hypothetical protein [Crocosphaera sp.]|uniref:hypothetical protein n=1 Tax=Crocosphaera sp. TaxID=2729996 RepID=UPI00261299DC|nr:hypothetical protein [Crocosphaera sp.]MDJ0578848.1 hypothetical protein [Crocosphaera sp.]